MVTLLAVLVSTEVEVKTSKHKIGIIIVTKDHSQASKEKFLTKINMQETHEGHSHSPLFNSFLGRSSWQRKHFLLRAKFIKSHLPPHEFLINLSVKLAHSS